MNNKLVIFKMFAVWLFSFNVVAVDAQNFCAPLANLKEFPVFDDVDFNDEFQTLSLVYLNNVRINSVTGIKDSIFEYQIIKPRKGLFKLQVKCNIVTVYCGDEEHDQIVDDFFTKTYIELGFETVGNLTIKHVGLHRDQDEIAIGHVHLVLSPNDTLSEEELEDFLRKLRSAKLLHRAEIDPILREFQAYNNQSDI